MLGAEMGVMGGPLGVAVGTGIGTVAGLAGWGIGQLFHHENHTASEEEIQASIRKENIRMRNIDTERKREADRLRQNAYWEAHPTQKIAYDAKQEAQRIDTRPQPTFKGKPVGGAFLGTYDSRPLNEQQSLQEILNIPEPEP